MLLMRTALKNVARALAAIAIAALPAVPAFASGCGGWCFVTPAVSGSVSASVNQSQMAWTHQVDMKQSGMIDIAGPDNLRAWVSGEQQLRGMGAGDFGQNQQLNASLQFSRPQPTWNPWVWWPSAQNVAVNVGVTVQTLLGWM
ncbi:MAG: hypothetical protein G01um101438_393 [Parcubacteria group bacterium Gr01-1014_38]|nr:MAG: hypothetical protein G01um101438_393 [Parcubacteria group bacterium Gr01-1014_38]